MVPAHVRAHAFGENHEERIAAVIERSDSKGSRTKLNRLIEELKLKEYQPTRD